MSLCASGTPSKRAGLPAAAPVAVDLPCAGSRGLVLDADEGVKRGVQPVDARERRIHQLGGAEPAARHRVRRLAEAHGRDLAAAPACAPGRAGAGPVAIRAAVPVGGLEGMQPLLQRGGLPVEVVIGARGLDRRMKLAELDRQLGHPLVGERNALALPVQPPDRLAADRHRSHPPSRRGVGAADRRRASARRLPRQPPLCANRSRPTSAAPRRRWRAGRGSRSRRCAAPAPRRRGPRCRERHPRPACR